MADNGKTLIRLLIALILGSYAFTAAVALILWNKGDQIVQSQVKIEDIREDIAEVKKASDEIKKLFSSHELFLTTQNNATRDAIRDLTLRLERVEKPLKMYLR